MGTLDFGIILKLAKSKHTSKKLLVFLSKDKDYIVRYYVASNPNTPIKILEKLSKYDVASNPNTPLFL